MQVISLPWQKWIDETDHAITLPDTWTVTVAGPAGAPDIGDQGVASAFDAPLGCPRLAVLAQGRGSAAIAVDDISRPTPTYRVLPRILQELEEGGIPASRTQIVVASGAHRQSGQWELLPKLGREAIQRVELISHVPYENLVTVGQTQQGTPVQTNRTYYEADLKLAIGSLMPHPSAGFGGGRKLVAVGLSSTKTLTAFHSRDAGWLRTGFIHGNSQHDDLEEIMRLVGLDFAVEAVLTPRGGIAELFTGEPTSCLMAGVERAWDVYSTSMPEAADVVVLNAYPKDYDLQQLTNVLWVLLYPNLNIVRPGGTIVCAGACPDGAGLHYLSSYGMSNPSFYEESSFAGRQVLFYSPNLSEAAVHRLFPGSVRVLHNWTEVLELLVARHGDRAAASIFPYASMQLNAQNRGRGPVPVDARL